MKKIIFKPNSLRLKVSLEKSSSEALSSSIENEVDSAIDTPEELTEVLQEGLDLNNACNQNENFDEPYYTELENEILS